MTRRGTKLETDARGLRSDRHVVSTLTIYTEVARNALIRTYILTSTSAMVARIMFSFSRSRSHSLYLLFSSFSFLRTKQFPLSERFERSIFRRKYFPPLLFRRPRKILYYVYLIWDMTPFTYSADLFNR